MKIGCIYTVERGASIEKPLLFGMDIPFGIATIATLLELRGDDVELFVFLNRLPFESKLRHYIKTHRPRLFCFTAVSTQFAFVSKLIRFVKSIDPSIFVVLGGHHASLDPVDTIQLTGLDAICIGEGDHCVIELAQALEAGKAVADIPHLWVKQVDGSINKTPPSPFMQNLNDLPYINRKMWEPWIKEPDRYPSVLLGRGCPFKCTYCSNHAMQQLSKGRFTRFRSPTHTVGEIAQICASYPDVDSIYLEVETIAHQKEAFPLFLELAKFNEKRQNKINFGLNFTVTSAFIRKEDRCREFLTMLNRANVVYLNIGLESGSERLRHDVLRRPKYSNEEFLGFAKLSHDYNINLDFYVLIGVPGETLDDYKETVALVRKAQPKTVFLSIFYPYLGTDLCKIAFEQGLISKQDMDPTAERALPALDLPNFPKHRVRLEYILFWFRVYGGLWPTTKILVQTIKAAINGSPSLWSVYQYLSENSRIFRYLRNHYYTHLRKRKDFGHMHRPQQIEFTYVD